MFKICDNKTNTEFIKSFFDCRKTLLENNSPLSQSYLDKHPFVPNGVLQWWSSISNAWNMAHIDWAAMAADVHTTAQIDYGNKLADKLIDLIGTGANQFLPVVYFKDCWTIMAIHVRGGEFYDYENDAVYQACIQRATRFEDCKHEYWEYLNKGCPVRSSVMYFWHAGYITDMQLQLILEPIDIELQLEDYGILDRIDLFDKFDFDKFNHLVNRVERVRAHQL